jgi:hypothetical protein
MRRLWDGCEVFVVKEINTLMQKFCAIWPHLDERGRRITAAAEAMAIGRGGISIVERACGLSRPTIYNGIREIEEHRILPPGRVRSSGAGRKLLMAELSSWRFTKLPS